MRWIIRSATILGVMLCLDVATGMAADGQTAPAKPVHPLFAFQDGLVGVPIEQQAKLLKELGYDGIEFNDALVRVPEMLKALDANGLKMFAIYAGANVNRDKPPYDPGLKKAIAQLKGRGTTISLYVTGAKAWPPDADDRAVAIIREIADMAEASGLRVSIYPHVGFYAARVGDAIRLVKKVDRKNVGVSFNLCHFLKLENEKDLEPRLKEAAPYLFAVSINGADGGDTTSMGWNRLIQTLDRGSFDVGRVLKTLKQVNYTGPIGLQCYAIPGDCRENLTRSMAAWRSLNAR